MGEANHLLIFHVAEWRFGLPLALVEKVVRAVAVTPLPEETGGAIGVIDVHGAVLPVLDLRKRFGAPRREVELSDCFVLVQVGDRRLALIAEAVEGVVAAEAADIVHPGHGGFPPIPGTEGVLRLVDGLVFIQGLTA